MMRHLRKPIFAALLAALSVVGASTLAIADTVSRRSPGTEPRAVTAGSTPPSTVESFEHPGAGRIFQDKGIKLFKGDGRIVFADCDNSSQQIQVWSRKNSDGKFCFRTTSTSGYLSPEVPEVYALQTEARALHVELSAE
ncbi:hypothetical protein ACWDQO_15030 [Streptomyces sp. NPDC003703]|uniref:hypothetical protein n=1 Tax=Streptomyces sp. NPDC003283 TaxID=3364681 RepID=UPI0036C398FC